MASPDRRHCMRWIVGVAVIVGSMTAPSSSHAQGKSVGPALSGLRHTGACVEQTAEGGYMVVGTVWLRGSLSSDILLVRTDPGGEEMWRRRYGGRDVDRGRGLQQTIDGGFALLGTTWSVTGKRSQIYLAKVDSGGNEMWSRTFGGKGREHGHAIREAPDGGYVVAGRTDSVGAGGEDAWLVRTDSLGEVLWQKPYGGDQGDGLYSVCLAADGFAAAGWTSSLGRGKTDVYVIQTDASGEPVWMRTFGGTGEDRGRSIQKTREGGFILTGSTWRPGSNDSDLYLLRVDDDGSRIWERALGGEYADHGHCAIQAADGGFMVVGNTWPLGTMGRSEIFLVRTHADGRTDWERRFGGAGDDYGYWVRQTEDGGFVVVGRSDSGGGRDRITLLKTDARGNLLWYKTYG